AQAAQTFSLSGPSSASAGQAVQFQASGSLSLGVVNLLDANGTQYATAPVLDGTTSVTLTFFAPTSTGTLTLTAWNNGENSNSVPLSVGSVGSQTTIAAPNVATVGTATKIIVNVNSAGQSAWSPTGSVVVKDGSGNVVTTMGLTANGNGKSYAYWWWTPPSVGSYAFTAYYSGDNVVSGSQSAQDLVNASLSGNTISLLAPAQMTVGVPVTLTATFVPSNIQGSVGFTFNGKPISASIQIVNGSASMQWTPTTAGAAVVGASYTTNGGASGSTTDKVNIIAGPVQQDVITLTQPGWGTWAPNGQYNLPNGTSTTMAASTLSGSPVTLTETGPCSISGLTITVPVASGQCNIQASSPGGKGYAPVTYGYTVLPGLGNQTATLAAPLSGKLTKGRTYVIETPGQVDTNAGQNISWKITQGKNAVCKLGYPADGSVTLKMIKKGVCNIQGTAPGVPNQWNPYVVTRSYRG
ncbi:MAG: Ig-like domain repeat protein, partial [Candidatus Nanopelagicales bacterium]